MWQEWMLSPSDFLGNMAAGDREALLALGHERAFERGEHVFQWGAPGRNVYLLEAGRVKIYKLSDTGKEVIQWFCLPGEIFGLAEVSRGGKREVYAQACTALRLHVVSRAEFTGFLSTHPATAMQVIDLLSCRMRVLQDMLLNLVTDDASSRIVKLLIRLAARYGKRSEQGIDLEIPLTHQEMADMVGTTRQTVTSVLGDLRRQGFLNMRNHHIRICDERLRETLVAAQPTQ